MKKSSNQSDSYIVLSDFSSFMLAKKVNEMIKEGWAPQGGVAAHSSTLYQAMVKVGLIKSMTTGAIHEDENT